MCVYFACQTQVVHAVKAVVYVFAPRATDEIGHRMFSLSNVHMYAQDFTRLCSEIEISFMFDSFDSRKHVQMHHSMVSTDAVITILCCQHSFTTTAETLPARLSQDEEATITKEIRARYERTSFCGLSFGVTCLNWRNCPQMSACKCSCTMFCMITK